MDVDQYGLRHLVKSAAVRDKYLNVLSEPCRLPALAKTKPRNGVNTVIPCQVTKTGIDTFLDINKELSSFYFSMYGSCKLLNNKYTKTDDLSLFKK